MTDARLKGEWLTAAAHDGLSDAAYRVFHNGLMHSNEQGTDGAITTRELRFLYPGPIPPKVLEEIVAAGFWERTETGYQFVDWSGALGQSSAKDVEAQRESNRARKRAQRERERAALAASKASTPTDAPDVSQALRSEVSQRESQQLSRRDVTAGVGQKTGQDYPPMLSKRRAGAHERTPARQARKFVEVDGRRVCATLPHERLANGTCRHCEVRAEELDAEPVAS